MRLLPAIALVLVGCGSKAKAADCDGYAKRFTDLIGADPSRRQSVESSAKSACESGRVTPAQIQCVEDASSAEDVNACMGVGSGGTAAAPTTSRVHITGVDGADVKQPAEMSHDQAWWWDHLTKRIATRCATVDLGKVAVTFDVKVTYTNGADPTDVSQAPEAVRPCLSFAFGGAHPGGGAGIPKNVPITFHLAIDPP